MVVGLDKFREHFADHADLYAVIGGTACSMIFEEIGIDFRQTNDIDMVLCVEVVDPSFAQSLKTTPGPERKSEFRRHCAGRKIRNADRPSHPRSI